MTRSGYKQRPNGYKQTLNGYMPKQRRGNDV
jgi:hypothetical protein